VIIAMSRPWRHPETDVFYFRSRLPADLREVVAGGSLTVDVAGSGSTVTAFHSRICSMKRCVFVQRGSRPNCARCWSQARENRLLMKAKQDSRRRPSS